MSTLNTVPLGPVGPVGPVVRHRWRELSIQVPLLMTYVLGLGVGSFSFFGIDDAPRVRALTYPVFVDVWEGALIFASIIAIVGSIMHLGKHPIDGLLVEGASSWASGTGLLMYLISLFLEPHWQLRPESGLPFYVVLPYALFPWLAFFRPFWAFTRRGRILDAAEALRHPPPASRPETIDLMAIADEAKQQAKERADDDQRDSHRGA